MDYLSLVNFHLFFTLDIVFLQMQVRGMMYYRKALELQAFLDMAKDEGTYSFQLKIKES